LNTAAYFIVILAVATALYFSVRWLVKSYAQFRGTRRVSCPETGRPALVEVDALRASLTSTVGLPFVQLQNCSRWPLKEQCGQECLVNLDVTPGECLVSGVLTRWYRGKNCVYCTRPFQELHWIDHHPALRSPGGELVTWSTGPTISRPYRPLMVSCLRGMQLPSRTCRQCWIVTCPYVGTVTSRNHFVWNIPTWSSIGHGGTAFPRALAARLRHVIADLRSHNER
jgi:hypothetical protein